MAKLSYAAAVKQYFASKGEKLHFPAKGSAEHSAIRALMASGDVTGDSAVSAAAAVLEPKAEKAEPKRSKKVAPSKKSENVPAKPEGTTLLDQPHINKEAIKEVVPEPEKAPVKKRKPRAVKADGLTPEAQNLKAATELNSGTMIAPADYPGLEGQIKKVLDVRPEGIPERKKKREVTIAKESKTLEGDKTDDAPAVQARAPFSFQSIRHLLRQ